MKKILRLAALTAIIGVSALEGTAQADPSCDFAQGHACWGTTGWTYCSNATGFCNCVNGYWDCGCGEGTGIECPPH